MISYTSNAVTVSQPCSKCGKQVDLNIRRPLSWLAVFRHWVELGSVCRECWEKGNVK